ncbi:fructose bisphosphate aldolase [Algoriphagus terrigena]|uniref:fructose bisphosphate aldolase n=1 Tax=Algoriphagus terrigena TaxID=344884 RepID=UPI00040407F7|nr:fructose bisphosphate aldolase [Algoriphagus terrigena]
MYTFQKQTQRIKEGKGFIAALDQSGGSTPKALLGYGIAESEYSSEAEMYALMHQMRARVMQDPGFTGDKIIGVILFEKTMNGQVNGMPTPEFLWSKGIVPFLKIDKGLKEKDLGVQLMKDIPSLSDVLEDAVSKGIFGTKMRSVILENNQDGIALIVKQQFELGRKILAQGLAPILEPEVDIHAAEKGEIEKLLLDEILKELEGMADDQPVILKLTIPNAANHYLTLVNHPKVLRVFALSGGYELDEACALLSKNQGMIASFSRALLNDLRADQSAADFSEALDTAIGKIYAASIT